MRSGPDYETNVVNGTLAGQSGQDFACIRARAAAALSFPQMCEPFIMKID
jgi:hypothetical protein